jgi:hypothetical protein
LKKNENIKALIYLLILNINLINQILNLIIWKHVYVKIYYVFETRMMMIQTKHESYEKMCISCSLCAFATSSFSSGVCLFPSWVI